MHCDDAGVAVIGCGNARQALVWLVRTDSAPRPGMVVAREDAPVAVLRVPGLDDGAYAVTLFDTRAGAVVSTSVATSVGGVMEVAVGPVCSDLAVAIAPSAR
jgi:hypothetical protein